MRRGARLRSTPVLLLLCAFGLVSSSEDGCGDISADCVSCFGTFESFAYCQTSPDDACDTDESLAACGSVFDLLGCAEYADLYASCYGASAPPDRPDGC